VSTQRATRSSGKFIVLSLSKSFLKVPFSSRKVLLLSSVLSHSAFICQVCVLNAKLRQTSFMTSLWKTKVFVICACYLHYFCGKGSKRSVHYQCSRKLACRIKKKPLVARLIFEKLYTHMRAKATRKRPPLSGADCWV
jgi:hypothetical protein